MNKQEELLLKLELNQTKQQLIMCQSQLLSSQINHLKEEEIKLREDISEISQDENNHETNIEKKNK